MSAASGSSPTLPGANAKRAAAILFPTAGMGAATKAFAGFPAASRRRNSRTPTVESIEKSAQMWVVPFAPMFTPVGQAAPVQVIQTNQTLPPSLGAPDAASTTAKLAGVLPAV